jgi:Toprim domain
LSRIERLRLASQPIRNTLAELYLVRDRGIILPDPSPDCLRYRSHATKNNETGEWYGALVGLATDADGDVLAVHLVYLGNDGHKAPIALNKKSIGFPTQAAVRLPGRRPLCLGEGLETCLSVWQATGLEVWVCGGEVNIIHQRLPSDIREVVILQDNDENKPDALKSARVYRDAMQSFRRRGLTVRVAKPPQPGFDFNDVLLSEGEGAIFKMIADGKIFRPRGGA